MIVFLSKWIEGIAIAVIIASIFEMILPNGNIKKYVKVVLGIYIVFSIIAPFSENKVKGNFDISKKVDELFENSNKEDNSKYESKSEQLNKIYENTFEKELVQTIEKEGFIVYKCDVKGNFNAEEENAGISKISVIVENTDTIICIPPKEKISISIYLCAFLCRLFKCRVEHFIFWGLSLSLFYLDGTGRNKDGRQTND